MVFNLRRRELTFLIAIYIFSVALRLLPKLFMDSHLPAFQGDVWYRICMAQSIHDHWALPEPDIRYHAYGYVPLWYPPFSLISLALLSRITTLDLPTVVTRVIPFVEGISPLSIYFLGKYLYEEKTAVYSTIILAATPSFVYWTGIADPQSLNLFLIPLCVLFFLKYAHKEYTLWHLLFAGVGLGIAFLFHLSYFVILLSLLMTSFFLFSQKIVKRTLFALLVLISLSQFVAAWWWYPRHLYWWWINVLTSSTGYYTPLEHFFAFGIVPASLGALGFIYLGVRKDKSVLLLLLWALPLFLETQNETILYAVGRIDLTWETLAKPLEGFRFYCFLAQPVSIAAGAFIVFVERKASIRLVLPLLLVALAMNLWVYNIAGDLTNAGMTRAEYDAAVWYRENSSESSLIVADYYRTQMIAGVCGGKALLGGLFPLRNVDYPYIRAPGQVQNDLYTLYTTTDVNVAWEIIARYRITHIFYSQSLEDSGYFGASLHEGFGLPVYLGKFYTEGFKVVYQNGDIIIFEVQE